MLNLGIPYPLFAGVVLLVCAIVGMIGIFAKWRSENIKIAMLVANTIALFVLVLVVPKMNLVMQTKLPAEVSYIHQDDPTNRLSKQFKQLKPRDQELLLRHLVRTFETNSPRGKTFGEAIALEKAYIQETEAQLAENIQSAISEIDDPDRKLRNNLQKGLVLELLSREVIVSPTTLTTRYQVTNRSEVAINGLTLGVRVRDNSIGLDLIEPSDCYISHYRRIEAGSVVDFDCETPQVAPEIVKLFVQSDPRFELSPVLRFVQLTNGRDLMFE